MSFFDNITDEDKAKQYLEQGSAEWDTIRIGRFTSSEMHRLMECGKRPMTEKELAARPKTGVGSKTTQVADPSKMGRAGVSYIRQKVWETLTGQAKGEVYAYALVYGKENEPAAIEHFERITGLEVERTGFQVYTDHAGGSPDGLIGEDEGLEIKCPSSDEQIDYLMLTDHHDLKNNYPQYYWQCVSLLLFTGRKRWHFCTFDPRIKEEKLQMTHLIIEAEKVAEDMDAVITAISAAVKEKLALIQTVRG